MSIRNDLLIGMRMVEPCKCGGTCLGRKPIPPDMGQKQITEFDAPNIGPHDPALRPLAAALAPTCGEMEARQLSLSSL